MSSARAVRLVHMMGLHRLDCPPEEVAPTLVPPRDWTELEERRRVFWGVFCIDSHCSVATGWPHLIDSSEVGNERYVKPRDRKLSLFFILGHDSSSIFRDCFSDW